MQSTVGTASYWINDGHINAPSLYHQILKIEANNVEVCYAGNLLYTFLNKPGRTAIDCVYIKLKNAVKLPSSIHKVSSI